MNCVIQESSVASAVSETSSDAAALTSADSELSSVTEDLLFILELNTCINTTKTYAADDNKPHFTTSLKGCPG